jgi:serine/threonine-protein phosphatase PGAM5
VGSVFAVYSTSYALRRAARAGSMNSPENELVTQTRRESQLHPRAGHSRLSWASDAKSGSHSGLGRSLMHTLYKKRRTKATGHCRKNDKVRDVAAVSRNSGNHLPERRLIVLVRHGQYETHDPTHGALTAIGKEQASHVAAFLSKTFSFDTAYSSTLARARETAAIIAKSSSAPFRATSLLCEGFPTRLIGHATAAEVAQDKKRFEAAFDKFFRAPKKRSNDLLVCHGNIIRYFVCRALGVPAKAWIKYGTNHTGITRIVVKKNGEMGVASYNETGHLPRKLVT